MTPARSTLLAITVGLLIGCTAFPAPAQSQASGRGSLYEGTATMTVELVDFHGDPAGVETYRTDVAVTLGPPGDKETNPVHLTIGPGQTANAPGEFTVVSATESSVGDAIAFFQHWSYRVIREDDDGFTFAGTLIDNESPEVSSVNVLTVPVEIAPDADTPVPLAMANGSEITGEVDGAALAIQIQGNSTDELHPFEIVVEASLTERSVAAQSKAGVSHGVITSDSVLMFAEPSAISDIVSTLSRGTRVTITGPSINDPISGTYLPVTLDNGLSGWVYEPFIQRTGLPDEPATGEPGVITSDSVYLRGSPSNLGSVLATLSAGDRVTITGPPVRDYVSQIDFVPVTLANGTSGWVAEMFVRRL